MTTKLIALAGSEARAIEILGLTAVGGAQSSGFRIAALANGDDYAVLSPAVQGISVRPLKGKHTKVVELVPGKALAIADLTLLAIEADAKVAANASGGTEVDRALADWAKIYLALESEADLGGALLTLLDSLRRQLQMEKGFIVQKLADDSFGLVTAIDDDARKQWLSETLIQKALSGSEPVFVQNVVGSPFENNRSLLATGFLSVCAWPLRFRGETLGVIVLGSSLPHSPLTETEKERAAFYAAAAAHLLHVHLAEARLRAQMEKLKRLHRTEDQPLLSDSPAILSVCALARKVAPSELGILIQGETGVGKEVLARWIHSKSEVARGPFVAVNCGAIPENLLESILFGHKKGAFTGALADQQGKFLLAHEGTLFLDEIGDMPLLLQVKLLRAIQERKIEPLGGAHSIPVKVRILAASHRELPALVAAGKFREDLYYRLAEITLEIPPLRERREDIELLVATFLRELGSNKTLSARAWAWVKAQDWSGNVRELLSATKKAVLLASGETIEIEDFRMGQPRDNPASGKIGANWLGGATLREASDNFVREKVAEALARTGGRRKEAAELLGVTPRTLFRYLEEFGENPDVTEMSH